MARQYTSSQAAKAAKVSSATVRSLTGGKYRAEYAGLWSSGATPGDGSARLLTEADITLLRYISVQTERGRSHAAIAADIRAGALNDISLPEPEEDEPEPPPPAPPPDQSRAMLDPTAAAMLAAMRDEFTAAHARNAELQTALIDAERRAAAADARAQVLEAELADRRRSWLSRLLGR